MENKDKKGTSYSTDIGYDKLDPFKRACQEAGLQLKNHEYYEEPTSRGESGFISWLYGPLAPGICTVIEGLGTKNIVAEDVYRLTGNPFGFNCIAQDTVAMIVNDMITVGALPVNINMHLAVGDSSWMDDERRVTALIQGWATGCKLSGAMWGGGETPTLKGIIHPDYPEISGSGFGTIDRKHHLRGDLIKAYDQIVFVASSGIHANGLTAARKVAGALPDGYMTKLGNGKTFGEALLQPTMNYVPLMRKLVEHGCDIHYAVNVTGHGFRKLMRADAPFNYHVFDIPDVPQEFTLIEETLGTDHKEMYTDFNMGVGYAFFVPAGESVTTILSKAKELGYKAWVGGEIRHAKEKSVYIKPLDHVLEGNTLAIR